MNKFQPLILAMLFLAANSCGQKKDDKPSEINDSQSLIKMIVNPPAAYRAAPLWDWNDKITREEIEFQMGKFKEGGLGGVFIHPRPGLVTEYLSEDWNELFQFTVQTAKKLDMQVWIYDENSYPSGFAGGHVQARYPDSYKNGTGLGLKITRDLKEITELPVEVLIKQSTGQLKLTGTCHLLCLLSHLSRAFILVWRFPLCRPALPGRHRYLYEGNHGRV
jgi:hypothetical protein